MVPSSPVAVNDSPTVVVPTATTARLETGAGAIPGVIRMATLDRSLQLPLASTALSAK